MNGIERLEGRTHFVASAGLDPKYVFGETAVAKQAGHDTDFFQAVPASADRTYLLAERLPTEPKRPSELMIVAITADGKLDPAFGTNGVALTGRSLQTHSSIDSPGILKLDPAGRLYFADNTRVMRFRRNGTADRTFGTRGVITYADATPSTALCDIAPTDDGVLIATTRTTSGIEHFDVFKAAGTRVNPVWSAEHDTGLESFDLDGSGSSAGAQVLRSNVAQFAQSRGGTVLVHVESEQELFYDNDPDIGPETLQGTTHDDLVVTRFDAADHGTDVARREMKRGEYKYDGTDLGDTDSAPGGQFQPAAVLSTNGRVLVVQADVELMRLDLRRATIHRYGLPGNGYATFQNPRYRLLPDGHVWVFDDVFRFPDVDYYGIHRYALDGTPDLTFGYGGTLRIRSRDTSAGNPEGIMQIFLGASGRFYVFSLGQINNKAGNEFLHRSMTIRRV